MLTSFFVAPTADLQAHKLNEGVPADFPSVLCNYMDEMKVASLENILTGRDASDAMKALANQVVYTHGESGIMVFRLDDGLVKSLASLTPESALEPAKRWLAIGDWGRFGRRAGDLGNLVETMAVIAKLASAVQAPTHGLFFWVCP